ncbi:NAD(P)H-dependent oxidoreductase [Solidesulfovibrio magneticus]|nr:NAD(P)H-dependent oxidoreductase [Solidesulfovibrio magneticus]
MAENWLVLDALGAAGEVGEALRKAVQGEAASRGVSCRFVSIPSSGLPSCRGCFSCWTKTPGQCCMADDGLGLSAAIAGSTSLVLLTPVVLGGHAPGLRLAMERAVLPNLLPYFSKVDGRSRHPNRYPAVPALYGIGLTVERDPESAQLFCSLVARNAANMRSPRHGAGVACRADGEAGAAAVVRSVLSDAVQPDARPRLIVALVGSPKPRGGVSATLANHVQDWLTRHGAVVRPFSLAAARQDEEAFVALAEALGEADAAYLSFPVYADAIPGAAVEVLERLCAYRREIAPDRPQAFFAVANCGFPEPVNCDAPLAMCRLFARQAGFAWLGGVGVGGGGMYEGRPLSSFGFLSTTARRALEAKAALLLSPPPPDLAQTGDILVPCPLPDRVYQWMADRGWQKALAGKDAVRDALARPYAVPGASS